MLEGLVICKSGYKINQNDFDGTKKALSKSKKKQKVRKNVLVENYNDVKKNPDFEDNYFSEIAEGIHKISHYSSRTRKSYAILIDLFMKI